MSRNTSSKSHRLPTNGRADLVRVPKKAVRNKNVLCEAYHYQSPVAFSRGMRVEMDSCSMIFISGTASVDETGRSVHAGDFIAQTRRTFANISALLASEGVDWHDVVKTTCYLPDFRHYQAFNEVRNAFYCELGLDPLPASTCVQAGLCRPELMVEIDAIAVVPKSRANLPPPSLTA
jgi:2-iminobutanoate/2-iminopropanoate deaminase